MWHVSVHSTGALALETMLRRIAYQILQGYGDASRGQWEECPDGIFHLRRRLSAEEQLIVGDVLDIRGTPEQDKRWQRVQQYLPVGMKNYKS